MGLRTIRSAVLVHLSRPTDAGRHGPLFLPILSRIRERPGLSLTSNGATLTLRLSRMLLQSCVLALLMPRPTRVRASPRVPMTRGLARPSKYSQPRRRIRDRLLRPPPAGRIRWTLSSPAAMTGSSRPSPSVVLNVARRRLRAGVPAPRNRPPAAGVASPTCHPQKCGVQTTRRRLPTRRHHPRASSAFLSPWPSPNSLAAAAAPTHVARAPQGLPARLHAPPPHLRAHRPHTPLPTPTSPPGTNAPSNPVPTTSHTLVCARLRYASASSGETTPTSAWRYEVRMCGRGRAKRERCEGPHWV